MTEPDQQQRQRRLAVAIAVLPVLAGVVIIALSQIIGGSEPAGTSPETVPEAQTQVAHQAAAPARPGTRAPTVRLTDARTGQPLERAAVKGKPYAVAFTSTGCSRFAGQLRRVLEHVHGGRNRVAMLAISADPQADTPASARAWLAKHREPPNLHYLTGSEAELQPYWEAWGASPSGGANCGGTLSVHLVDAGGVNAGVVDLGSKGQPALVAADLEALAH